MYRLVASGGPTRALLNADGMIRASNEQPGAADLLHVAFQAEIRVAFSKKFGINGAVHLMTGRAAFTKRFVFEDGGTTLARMAAEAHVV